MNKALIENWNKNVGINDIVFFLGDFGFFKNEEQVHDLVIQLYGKIHLIVGNHDEKVLSAYRSYPHLFETVQNYREVRIDGITVVLSHYPMLDWNGSFYGSFMLSGHIHSLRRDIENKCRRYDVGVDNNKFAPINFENIYKELSNKPLMCINTIRDGVPLG